MHYHNPLTSEWPPEKGGLMIIPTVGCTDGISKVRSAEKSPVNIEGLLILPTVAAIRV